MRLARFSRQSSTSIGRLEGARGGIGYGTDSEHGRWLTHSAMETERLRKIQQPTHLERLLEALITRSNLVPKDSYQIRDPEAVAAPLRRIALRAVEEGRVWACWACGPQQWIFTAEMPLSLSRERGTPVLSIHRYGEDGLLTETGNWLVGPNGLWQRCAE